MKFAQRENTPSRATIYLLDTMRKRKREGERMCVRGKERKRHVSVCIPEGAERLMAKEEQSVYSSGVC